MEQEQVYQSIEAQGSLERAVVSQHEVLRLEECKATRERVFALKEHWTQRAEKRFFTLGAAAYLDAPAHHENYVRAAKALNPVLREHFDWLYERVRRGFEGLLGQPVSYADECALPGFHIFVFQGRGQTQGKPLDRAHFDMQWMHAMPNCRPEETLSFTLSVEEPSGGSSMEIWPAHCRNVSSSSFNALEFASVYPSRTVRYSRGHMVVHDGLLLHAIGLSSISTPNGYRITFQGHGTRISHCWRLYW
jgi:hypothetical protein